MNKVALAGLLAAMVAADVAAADTLKVTAYYGGEQLCAINTSGSSPHTIKCCPTATHDLNIRRRHGGEVSVGRGSSTVWVTCIPIDHEVANTFTGG